MQAIPEFAKLLSSKNTEVLVSVATCIHQLSKKESSVHALLSYPHLISTLLHTLGTATDHEVRSVSRNIFSSFKESFLDALFK